MRNIKYIRSIASAMVLLAAMISTVAQAKSAMTPEEARAIAKQAYIYGFPLADS